LVTDSKSPKQDPILKRGQGRRRFPTRDLGISTFHKIRMVLNYEWKLLCQRSWQFYGVYLDLTDRGTHEGPGSWKVASIKL